MDIVMALLFVLGFLTAYLLFDRFVVQASSGSRASGERSNRDFGARIVPTLYMAQLDKRSSSPTMKFELNDVVMCSEEGYAVYGSRADQIPRNGLKLSSKCPEAEYVDPAGHAVIFKDEGVYYIENKSKSNGMRLSGCVELLDKVAIVDGMVVYLGLQPVQFLFVNQKYTWNDRNRASGDNNPNVRSKPVRRNKPGSVR